MANRSAMSSSVVLVAVLALKPGHGHAQQVGIYAGREANGSTISITVVEDTYVHKLAIASLTSMVSARCRNHVGYNAVTTVAPAIVAITGNTVLYEWNLGTYFVRATMTFDNATNTVNGDIVSYNVIFAGEKNGVPTGVTFCTDKDQYFDAVLTPGSSTNPKADVV